MNNNALKGILLLIVIVAGSLSAWYLYTNKSQGKHHKAATAMLDKIFQTKYRTRDEQKLEFGFDKAVRSGKGRYTLSKLEIKPHGANTPLTIGQLKVDKLDLKNEVPNFFTLRFEGISIKRENMPSPAFYIPFLQLGMNEILLDVTVSKHLDDNKKTLETVLVLKARKLFTVTARLDMDRFSPKLIPMIIKNAANYDTDIQMLISQARIRSIKLEFVNNGIMQRLDKLASTELRKTFKDSLLKQQQAQSNPVMKQAIQALIEFMDKKGKMTLTIKPSNPVAMDDLFKTHPNDMGKLLNLQIKAN